MLVLPVNKGYSLIIIITEEVANFTLISWLSAGQTIENCNLSSAKNSGQNDHATCPCFMMKIVSSNQFKLRNGNVSV